MSIRPQNFSSPRKGEGGAKRRVGVDGSDASRFDRTPLKTVRARELRKAMTPAEARLWSHLRNNQLENLGFRRQHPMGKYILDFYCASLKLAIELDGGQHNEPTHAVRDKARDYWFAAKGIETLRIWNSEVLEDTSSAIETIWDAAMKRKEVIPTLVLPFSRGGNGVESTS
jgi:very-short-patch-repair endonuclease